MGSYRWCWSGGGHHGWWWCCCGWNTSPEDHFLSGHSRQVPQPTGPCCLQFCLGCKEEGQSTECRKDQLEGISGTNPWWVSFALLELKLKHSCQLFIEIVVHVYQSITIIHSAQLSSFLNNKWIISLYQGWKMLMQSIKIKPSVTSASIPWWVLKSNKPSRGITTLPCPSKK